MSDQTSNRVHPVGSARLQGLELVTSAFMVGNVAVTRVEERIYSFPIEGFIPEATPQRLASNLDWLATYGVEDLATMTMPVNGYVLDTGDKRILVDTCVGLEHSESEPQSLFLDRLKACGYDPDTFDVIICTHFHYDHIGWNTKLLGRERVPTFANARYVFSQTEWDGAREWTPGTEFEAVLRESFERHVGFIVSNGYADLVSGETAIAREVAIVPTPGHTPGHVSVAIASEGYAALITGDAVHHPLQLAMPTISTTADDDTESTIASRESLIDWAVSNDALIIGSHFSGPGMGYISRDDNRTVFEPTRKRRTS
jgi:glyoxylase-like metal-dependent hydrolase (beta-lactamase superfamily II)